MIAVAGHSSSDVGPAATLAATIEAWRADRSSVALANKVDELSSQIPRVVPARRIHRWWLDLAATYEPERVGTLLATLHLQARASKRGEWASFFERLERVLAWPDDPRVAMALAGCLREPPMLAVRTTLAHRRTAHAMFETVARRITAIGDLRALARISPLRPHFSDPVREHIALALARAPAPMHVDTATSPGWQAVLADPFSLHARMVLADEYLGRGDPRGDLIAFQCAPHLALEEAATAGRALDPSVVFGRDRARIDKLVGEHWYRWFGAVAPVVYESSIMKGGLLARIHVGRDRTPAWAWEACARHHELCAVEEVAAVHRIDPECYAAFVLAMPRMPRWVQITETFLAAIRGQARAPVPLVGVCYRVDVRHPIDFAEELLALAPGLERLTVDSFGPDPRAEALVARLPNVKVSVRAR